MDNTRKPYEGPEPYIFISYARKDKNTVFPLLDVLCGAGYRIWYDEGIQLADDWADNIAAHLAGSTILLAFHSSASAQSEHCKAEIHYGRSKKRPILSVYLEDGVTLPPGLEMYLGLWQAVKLSAFKNGAAFVARLGDEEALAPCKEPEWHKIGEIQWKLDTDDVLTIARNVDLPDFWRFVSIPGYQTDLKNDGSTAPWMPYREKIRFVVIANHIDTIGDYAFSSCVALTAVTIPDSVTKIGSFAFAGCVHLTAVSIPNSVSEIGNNAFAGCISMTDLTIPDSVTKIGLAVFWNCTNLTALTIPDSVTKIDDGTFSHCTHLTAVAIPDSVTKIGSVVFWNCTNLTAVIIPDSVREIGLLAFHNCHKLKRVEIPAGVTLGDRAFDDHTTVVRRGKVREYSAG